MKFYNEVIADIHIEMGMTEGLFNINAINGIKLVKL